MSIVKQLVQRADSWVNAMTGLGTLRDKLTHAQVVPGAKVDDYALEALFNDDDVARRIVTKLPREATRRGFRIALEGDDDGDADEDESADVAAEMQDRFQKLDAMPKLRDGWIWARLYGGGSGVFVGADDGQSVDQPLDETKIRSISFLNVIKKPQLSIARRYTDLTAPRFGEPEIYNVHRAQTVSLAPREGIEVHESRLILFDGAMTARSTMDSASGFDDSVLQAAMASLQQNATAWQSIAHLLTDASQGVLKIANLVDLVAADGQETLRARVQLMDMARSVCRSILIDAEKESFERIATSFAGLPEVMDRLMMRMSSAADGMPVTLLFGRSPAGLNATGESDIRSWYDTVAEGQTDEFKPRLERLLRLMFMAKDSPTRGRMPENWCIEFNPLWQPTDKELADTKKVKADTYVALVGAQIMTDAEAGLGLAPDFPTIDVESREELAEADKDEGLRPREVNVPPPEPANDNGDPDDDGGGGGGEGNGPKGRSDSAREDAQARVPAGSSKGGQWTSGGGATGGKAAALAAIGKSVATGKNAAVVAMQQKLVQRYGVPLQKAALMYERDIKAQLKAAKGAKKKVSVEAMHPPKPTTTAFGLEAMKQGTVELLAEHGKPDIKAAAIAYLKSKGLAVPVSSASSPLTSNREYIAFETAAQHGGLAGHLTTTTATHISKHASKVGLERSAQGPLVVERSPHQKALDEMAKRKVSTTGVVKEALGEQTAVQAHKWKQKWVDDSTDEAADEVLGGINNPSHHAHAQYHATQALLRQHLPEMQRRGIVDADGYITLYRGVKKEGQGSKLEASFARAKDGSVPMDVRGVSSWSGSHKVARESFAQSDGTVVQHRVHYSNALAVHNFEHRWTLKEIEWTLVTPKKRFQVVRADESVTDPY